MQPLGCFAPSQGYRETRRRPLSHIAGRKSLWISLLERFLRGTPYGAFQIISPFGSENSKEETSRFSVVPSGWTSNSVFPSIARGFPV